MHRKSVQRLSVLLTLGLLAALPGSLLAAQEERQEEKKSSPAPTESSTPGKSKPLKTITNSIGMKLVLIPAGEFMIGSPDSDKDAFENEHPQVRVKIEKAFYLGVTEVTREQYRHVTGDTSKGLKDYPQHPALVGPYEDTVEFCRRLGKKEGRTYRLPTEVQWEYACRAGSTTKWCFGDDESQLGDYAWYCDNSDSHAIWGGCSVGQKKPNAWGLYDMHGNVWEWCLDWYKEEHDGKSTNIDLNRVMRWHGRVYRGGSWRTYARATRSASRDWTPPMEMGPPVGFRVALVPEE